MTFDTAEGIKQLRIKYQVTQATLAEKLGLTVETLSNYETGKTQPDMLTVIKIADLFKCSTDHVIRFDKGLSIFEEFNKEIIKEYRPVNSHDKMIGKTNMLNMDLPDSIYTDVMKGKSDLVDKF